MHGSAGDGAGALSQAELTALNVELGEVTPLADAYGALARLRAEAAELQALAAGAEEPDMRALAAEELQALLQQVRLCPCSAHRPARHHQPCQPCSDQVLAAGGEADMRALAAEELLAQVQLCPCSAHPPSRHHQPCQPCSDRGLLGSQIQSSLPVDEVRQAMAGSLRWAAEGTMFMTAQVQVPLAKLRCYPLPLLTKGSVASSGAGAGGGAAGLDAAGGCCGRQGRPCGGTTMSR